MPQAVDPALQLLQSALRSPQPQGGGNLANTLLARAAQDGPTVAPTPSNTSSNAASNVASQPLPLQIGPLNTGITMPSWLSEIAAGSGSKLADWGLGAEQIAANAAAKLDPSRFGQAPANLAGQAAQKRAIDAPLLKTWGGWIGSNATGMAPALIPGAQGLGALTALGAAQGALMPTTAGQSRLLNTALGGAFGAGGKLAGDAAGDWLASRIGAAARPALTDAQQSALAQGESLGLRATPGQQLGSKPLQQVEASLQSHPWTSGPFARVGSANQAALDRVAARSIGENAATVDANVMGRANDRLGATFENVRNPGHVIMFDPQATNAALDGIDQEFKGLLPNDMSIRDNGLVSQLDTLAGNGHATAQQLGQLSSKLGKAAYKQMTGPTGDRDLGQALYQAKDHVDDLLESALTGEERAEYAAARGQYRNLMLLTSRTGIVNPSTGNLSGAALASKLQQADRTGFTFGKNTSDLYKGARFAQAFKPIVGDSGTATRSAHLGLAAAIPLAIAGHMTGVPLGEAAGLLPLAAQVGSNVGARVYMSRLGQAGLMGLMSGARALPRGAAAASRFAAPAVRRGLMGAGLDAWPLMSSP